ncbi:Protein neprosin [Cardamine amara subsp. amara]|uniref:Protein neprosin n=1 Tax=Cardamine amara subsp. amara TaxID=228776 RepID=A0ABD1AKW8_CARAN
MVILRFFLVLAFITLAHSVTTQISDTYGDIVYCVDKHNQPAFEHPLLKNHKLQESPSEFPRVIGATKKNQWPTSEAHVSTAKCPPGTVPIQNITALNHRTKPETGNNNSFIYKHEYAEVTTDGLQKLYGTRATVSVWKPVVENRDEMSISQIWIVSGDYEKHDLNTIEVGWQSDAYAITGGYNLQEPGFIQTSSEVVLGGTISPISSFGGSQFEISILVWKDPKSGNWWLSLGSDHSLVGYWPRELFTTLADHATKINWGGEIVDSHSFGQHTKTQMGSGRFSEEGFGKASYFRNIERVDDTNTFQPDQELVIEEEGTYYDTKILHTDEWGTHIFYGGPGFGYTHSGVVPLRLSLFFICFSFILFITI